MPYRVENIVRNREIACNVFHSYISLVCQNAALCGNGCGKDIGQAQNQTTDLHFWSPVHYRMSYASSAINLVNKTRGQWWPWIAHLSHFPHKWTLHLCSFGSNLWPLGGTSFDPKGHHLNKIDKGLQGCYTQKSKLYPFQFQRRRILRLVFFVPMFQLVTHRVRGQF